MVIAGSWVEGRLGPYCLIGMEFQFYKMKMDGGDGCTTM